MRLILALLLLASPVFAVDGNTVDRWTFEQNANGSSYNWIENGTLTYNTSPTAPQGTYQIGPFTSGNYLDVTSTSSMTAVMNGATAWSAEGFFYFNSLSTEPALFEFYQSAGSNVWVQVTNLGAVRLGINGAVGADTATGTIVTGAWYFIAATGTNTGGKLYVSLADNIDSVADATSAGNFTLPSAIEHITLGKLVLAVGRTLNGYLDAVEISKVARTSFPTTDPSGATSTPRRGFDLDLDMDLSKVFENGIGWLSSLFTTRLEAYPAYSDDWKAWKAKKYKEVKTDKTQTAIAAELTKIAKFCEKPKGNCSPTPTPTMSPTITQTPNPAQLSVTATATPTPTVTP